jgi:aryl-alcohol dehydrogenase-like predicted oxidoreductase
MKIALGTVQFGLAYGVANTTGRVGADTAAEIMQQARLAGIDSLDTAIAYGDSEKVLGNLGVSSWRVVSKLPAMPENCGNVYAWVQEQLNGSLQRLGISALYGLLLHRPAQLFEPQGHELYQALKQIKVDGLVEKIGISIYGPDELAQLFDIYDFDIVQAPLNILDRRLIESGWSDQLHQAGVEVHTRSAFLQGLLLMPANQRPTAFQRWANVWAVWDEWLSNTGLSPLQACLRYVNAIHSVDSVVVGVDTAYQLQQIIVAADGKLPNLPIFPSLQDSRLINPSSWSQL